MERGEIISSTGLWPIRGEEAIELEVGVDLDEKAEVWVLAWDLARLSKIPLPSDRELESTPVVSASGSGTRLPRASWLGKGQVLGDSTVLATSEEDLPLTTPWLPACTVDPCEALPVEGWDLLELPGSVRGTKIALPLSGEEAFLGTTDGLFYRVDPKVSAVPLTELSTTGVARVGTLLADGRIALLGRDGSLAVARMGSGFEDAMVTDVYDGALAASRTDPAELFLASEIGRLYRWRGGTELELMFEVPSPEANVDAFWMGPGEVMAAFLGSEKVLHFVEGAPRIYPLVRVAAIAKVGAEVVAVTRDLGDGQGGSGFFRLTSKGFELITAETGLIFGARFIWPIDDRSFFVGGTRGELRFVHLDLPGSCGLGGLPFSNINQVAVLEHGFMAGIDAEANIGAGRTALFLRRRPVPPACVLE